MAIKSAFMNYIDTRRCGKSEPVTYDDLVTLYQTLMKEAFPDYVVHLPLIIILKSLSTIVDTVCVKETSETHAILHSGVRLKQLYWDW